MDKGKKAREDNLKGEVTNPELVPKVKRVSLAKNSTKPWRGCKSGAQGRGKGFGNYSLEGGAEGPIKEVEK